MICRVQRRGKIIYERDLEIFELFGESLRIGSAAVQLSGMENEANEDKAGYAGFTICQLLPFNRSRRTGRKHTTNEL
jgi:hypothetical protein